MIVSVASRKASPGVTTMTSMLAAFWQEPDVLRLIVEADPSGGTLAARWQQAHDISWDPGLVAMSAIRREVDRDSLELVSQRVGEGLHVCAAPPSPTQVTSALVSAGDRTAASLAAAPGVRAFVDCGRIGMTSSAVTFARRSALTILMCRPNLEEVHTLLPGVVELRDAGCILGLVLVGDGPYHPTEVAESAEIELLGHLPDDARAAQAWATDGVMAGRSFAKSRLARTMSDLSALVAQRCAEVVAPDVLAGPEPSQNKPQPVPVAKTAEPVGFAKLLEGAASNGSSSDGSSSGGADHG